MQKVLMVCLGNICRSPMAEGVLRKKLAEAGLTIEVDSAGTGNYHSGETPDERAVVVMAQQNIDISALRARQFKKEDFEKFDIIYTMDSSNFNDVMDLGANEKQRRKVRMLLNEMWPGQNRAVPDPWFGGPEGFHEVYSLLDRACDALISNLKMKVQ